MLTKEQRIAQAQEELNRIMSGTPTPLHTESPAQPMFDFSNISSAGFWADGDPRNNGVRNIEHSRTPASQSSEDEGVGGQHDTMTSSNVKKSLSVKKKLISTKVTSAPVGGQLTESPNSNGGLLNTSLTNTPPTPQSPDEQCSKFQTSETTFDNSNTEVPGEAGDALKELLQKIDMDKAKAELCRRDFFYFVQQFWSIIINEEPVWNWHIKYLCDELQGIGQRLARREKKESDVIINVPPSTSKSTICSIMFPCWLWTIDPTLKVISGSYSAALAMEQSTKSRTIIKSDKYRTWFPQVVLKDDQDVKSNYQTTAGGARLTTSTGAMITGMHAHIIIVDDPQNPELANSEVERERTNEWVSGTLSTRKVNKEVAVTCTVQQRLHPMDVTGYLLSKGKDYKHICLPAELNKTVKPAELADKYIDGLLDPIRLSRSILQETLVDLGSKSYNTQMGQSPQNDEDSIIQEKWLTIIPLSEFQTIIKDQKYVVDFYADTAYTENTKNDPSAILACTRIGEILYILNVSQVWMDFPKLVAYINTFSKANGYTNRSRIYVEPKASGKSIVQYLKTQTSLNIKEGAVPKVSKIERLNAVAPKVEAGKVVLVQGGWNSLFLSEVTANEPAHDDMRDTFVMAVQDKMMKPKGHGKYNIR